MIELDKEAMPQKTNLDALREMSAEEIGEFINKLTNAEVLSIENCDDCAFCTLCPIVESCGIRDDSTNCAENFTKWLNSPVEDDIDIDICAICQHQDTCIDGGIDVVKEACSDFKCVEVKEDEARL